MLVSISYSIDFDEVPKVVRKFLQEDIQKELGASILCKVEDSIAYLENDRENIGKAIQTIEEIREFVLKMDMRLNECSGILKGYQKELLDPAEPTGPLLEDSPSDTSLSEIQEELSTIRENFNGVTNEIKNR